MDKKATINRRDFIKAGAVAGGGLLIAIAIPFKGLLSTNALPNTFAPNAFLRIGENDSIAIILSKVEMGQGIWTTLPMLIAEELDCDWNKITVEHSPPGTASDFSKPLAVRSTGGSEYKMLRIGEMSEIEVYIVPSSEKMGGAGEPGVPPIAPALTNAIFAATGNRLRRLPVRQNDLIKSVANRKS